MKKIKWLLILFISVFSFNMNVWAASVTLSVSSKSVKVGDTFTVYANMKSSAAWNIHVTASGPVSGCVINQADASADANDVSKTFSATCTATGEGTINITMSGDVTSASDGNAVNISGTTSVNVTKKTTNSNSNTNKPTNSNSNKPSNTNTNTNANSNLSKNNNLKELSVEGYELTKVDDKNYTLSVGKDVSSIKINAIAEDNKAKVTGNGQHDLKVGENKIKVTITSESGDQNNITIMVTRKDDYYLSDLEDLLNNSKNQEISITISSDTKIPASTISKIKEKKKKVSFNCYEEDKKLVYSWILDGNKIGKVKEDLLTTISYESPNKKEIASLSNYAEGIYVYLKHQGKIPEGTKIKVLAGEKYEDGYVLKAYQYINKNLELMSEDVIVSNGVMELELGNSVDYFITMSNIGITNNTAVNEEENIDIFLIIAIIELMVIIVLTVLYFNKGKNSNNKNIESIVIEEPKKLESIDMEEDIEELDIEENSDDSDDLD